MTSDKSITRPDSTILTSSLADAVEVIPMGGVTALFQADEAGEQQNIMIDEALARQLLPILQQMVGGR